MNTQGFLDLFLARARTAPEALFARFNGTPMRFGTLARSAEAFAAALRRCGIGRGDRVAVMMRNSPPALAAIFGLARAGAVWVPVNAQLRGPGLAYVLEHCDPALVAADPELMPMIADCVASLGTVPMVDRTEVERWFSTETGFDEPLPAPENCLAIFYTSGTTGPPKGVMLSHAMLRFAAEAVALVAAPQPNDVFLMWEPLYHIGGAQLLVLPLITDVTLAMVDRFSASRFWRQVREYRASHIHYLGGILQLLLKQPPSPLDREHGVRIAWGGGCPADLWSPFEERFGVEVREAYGMTEASSITTYNDRHVVGSVGRPVPWFEVTLRNANGNPAVSGERGEIVVQPRRPGALFSGYFRNAEATAQALRDGVLWTGDLGRLDADGNLLFLGRISDSVRRKGENVSAWEVERVAAAHPDIEDCAVIGVAAEIGEQEIKLFVRPKPGTSIDPVELSCWLKERLAPYQNPRYIALVSAFERTPSQRIMKQALSRATEDCWDRLAADRAAIASPQQEGLVMSQTDAATRWPNFREDDFVIKDYRFASGEVLPELRLHYRTMGVPRRDPAGKIVNAVLLLQGNTGTGANWLRPSLADELYGPGQPLNATQYFFIMQDALGRGGSSKPSDGLRGNFPHYRYRDMVESGYRLITEHLGVGHLRLVIGSSMGGMHAWMWAEMYPYLMDGVIALSCQPVEISGRNWLGRRAAAEAIRNDPDWKGGFYEKQPRHYIYSAAGNFNTESPTRIQEMAPTLAAADALYERRLAEAAKGDANDALWAIEAIRDYNPEPNLDKIKARVLLINDAEDHANPPELGTVERAMQRLKNGRYVLIPAGPDTHGHFSHYYGKLWKPYLVDFLASLDPAQQPAAD